MQYDLKKTLEDKAKVNLQWHGEPTRVLVRGQGEKTVVNTGDVLTVDKKQAAELLGYSPLWTLEGDTPTPQPYMENLKRLAEKKVEAPAGDEEKELTPAAVEKMNKKQLQAELKKLGATFNDQASNADLKELLLATMEAGAPAGDEENTNGPELVDHVLTQEDLDAAPELVAEGFKVGDTIQLPKVEEETGEDQTTA